MALLREKSENNIVYALDVVEDVVLMKIKNIHPRWRGARPLEVQFFFCFFRISRIILWVSY